MNFESLVHETRTALLSKSGPLAFRKSPKMWSDFVDNMLLRLAQKAYEEGTRDAAVARLTRGPIGIDVSGYQPSQIIGPFSSREEVEEVQELLEEPGAMIEKILKLEDRIDAVEGRLNDTRIVVTGTSQRVQMVGENLTSLDVVVRDLGQKLSLVNSRLQVGLGMIDELRCDVDLMTGLSKKHPGKGAGRSGKTVRTTGAK